MLKEKINSAIWVANSLFGRGKTSGASANMSFRHNEVIYITTSGSCFGTLQEANFAPIDMNGKPVSDKGKPSKEWPLHVALYKKSPEIGAVIHTHSLYSILWSVAAESELDCIPEHTPYLKMRLGAVGLIPYAQPGSEELFSAFRERVGLSDGFILKRHGPIVPGKSIMDAFYNLEELEESARIAWELYRTKLKAN